jgi:hypothetical protein
MRQAGCVVLATIAIVLAAGCGADQPDENAQPPAKGKRGTIASRRPLAALSTQRHHVRVTK